MASRAPVPICEWPTWPRCWWRPARPNSGGLEHILDVLEGVGVEDVGEAQIGLAVVLDAVHRVARDEDGPARTDLLRRSVDGDQALGDLVAGPLSHWRADASTIVMSGERPTAARRRSARARRAPRRPGGCPGHSPWRSSRRRCPSPARAAGRRGGPTPR